MNRPILTHRGRTSWWSRLYLRWTIKLFEPRLFAGLKEIVLFGADMSCELQDDQMRPDASSCVLSVPGYYFFGSTGKLPWIGIYLDEVSRGIPFPLSFTPLMVFRFGRVLAHEAMHHRLHLKPDKQYVPVHEEALADAFADRFERVLSRHWLFGFWRWLLHDLSRWHFVAGSVDFRAGDLHRAQQKFYTAWLLDRRNTDAATLFWQLCESRSSDTVRANGHSKSDSTR